MFLSMETARTFMDLTVSQTLHNFTNTYFVLPHGVCLRIRWHLVLLILSLPFFTVGGAFPAMIDRVLKTRRPELYDSALDIFRTR
jgi:6-methylsalicylate decarboxylase